MKNPFSFRLNSGPIIALCVAATLSGCLGEDDNDSGEPLVTVAKSAAGFDYGETASAQAKTLSEAGVHVSRTKCYGSIPPIYDPAVGIGTPIMPGVLYVHEIQLKDIDTAESLGFKRSYSTQDYNAADMPCVTPQGIPSIPQG